MAGGDGETAGDCEGGGKVGDFAGDAGWVAGECAGGVAGVGGLATGGEGVDLGEGAGAFCARTEDVKNNANTKNGSNNLFIIIMITVLGNFNDSENYEEVVKDFTNNNNNVEKCFVLK